MYLKCIEIQGFKSFANKIRFDFHNGITGIVGPNGSGKSNVADAVRWVLGEQKVKQLRGSSMQDVIFAGTEARKPMGYAYVAITLDNSDHKLPTDYKEVTVARRIYRSGDTEYLMNGTPCRLRDINELFYDTGIGKEGYSIIGQGQIDKILSDKPEDRRELFDEAVGIVKFKRRKDMTLKKLASEKENLVRINDILAELEKQIPTLERQSEKAKVFFKERDALKARDVNLFLLENRKNIAELEKVKESEETIERDLEQAREAQARTGEEYESGQARLSGLESEIEAIRGRITSASVVREKIEGEIKVIEEQVRAATGNAEHFRSRKEAVSAEIEKSRGEEKEILTRKGEIDEKLEQLRREQLGAKENAAACADQIIRYSRQVDLGKNEILRILSERATIKSNIASISARQEENERRMQELSVGIEQAQSNETEQAQIITDLRRQFGEIAASIKALQERQKEIETTISGMKKRLGDEDEQLRESQLRYHQEKSRLDALVNLTERYEGFGGSVRKVMQNRSSEKGVIGVVADLLKTDKKYETAIEVALGGNIQNIVTEDAQTARRMIELLKREKAGRATFLPLNDLGRPQEFKNTKILQEPGVIGLADSLVRCDDRYRPVAASLLGRIVIVDGFDHAAAVNKKYSHSVRMVTLEGELFMPGGAISGGAFKNSSNLLGRRREMAELQQRVKEYETQMQQHEQAIEDIKSGRTSLRKELEENRQAQQDAFLRQNTVRMSIASQQEKKKEAAGSAEEMAREKGLIEQQKKDLEADRRDAEERLASSADGERKMNDAVSELEQKLTALRKEEGEATQVLAKWDMEIEKILQRQSFEQKDLDRIQEDLIRRGRELEEIETAITRGDSVIATGAERIRALRGQLSDSQDAQDDGRKELSDKNEEREKLKKAMQEMIASRESLSEQIHALDKESVRLHNRHERLQEDVDNRVAYMWTEYEITLSDAMKLRDEQFTDIAVLKKEIAEIKARIKALGSVNVDAIEEYRELMERYTFLKTQHDDLIQAAASLEKIIEELDTAMRKQFQEQFSRIQAEFDKVFKLMFGGGKGRLELMEDRDILEAGVRVIAQPPGKKLQNMNALSGGEKALTAIALLFAIQNLKPSPFCLLDEIEAALDESNVVRFAEYLHKLTEHTQFIVITHRRGTMQEADRLYGITMQEKGVSALVSVDLIDEEELVS
ncbi:MAG: chromosome segregation protein SMC [Lachnospiraceae bacterium]|nr:chromosome segregation protein SMC [Lachnospiraceae bacterium]